MKRPAALLVFGLAVLAAAGVSLAASGPTLSLSESSAYEYVSGSTLYYAPTGSNNGSFTVTAAAPAGSTIDTVTFPDVFGSDGATASSTLSKTYTWTATSTGSGSKKVDAVYEAIPPATSTTGSSTFTVTSDTTAPTGQSVALSGGPWFKAGAVPLTITGGSDTGAGVDSSKGVVERAAAPLTSGSCGTFGTTFTAVTLTGSSDTSATGGNCYRYQYKATDNVGNVSAASAVSTDAKVDSTAPGTPSIYFSGLTHAAGVGTVLYYPPAGSGSFTVAAVATDAESGIASYAFSSTSGFTAGGTGASRTFTFSGAPATAPGPVSVTATNGVGMTSAPASFTLAPDPTPPTLTITCNGKPCLSTPYAKAVLVAITAVDGGGSGLDTIRYTTGGKDPTADAGVEYTRPITVTSLAQLRARGYDKVGNASRITAATIRSLADRLLFSAPAQVKVKLKARYLQARVTCSARATVTAVLKGSGLRTPQRWRFLLGSGTSIVQFRLPPKLARPGRYTVTWTVQAGGKTVKRSTRVVLGRP